MHTPSIDGITGTQIPPQGSQSSNPRGQSAGQSAAKAPTMRQVIAAEKGHRPVLLTAAQAAALYGISERTFHAMRAAGLVPPPVELGPRLLRWPMADLEAGVAAMPRKQAASPEPVTLVRGKQRAKASATAGA